MPFCVVTSIVALALLGPMCHNSDRESAVSSACRLRDTNVLLAGKDSLSCSLVFI